MYWTNGDRDGLLDASLDLGYNRAAADTTFLLLEPTDPVPGPPFPDAPNLGALESGLNELRPNQLAILESLLRSPEPRLVAEPVSPIRRRAIAP